MPRRLAPFMLVSAALSACPIASLVPSFAPSLAPASARAGILLADLTPEQRALLNAAEGHMRTLEANLGLARQSAGTGTPKGSRAKLAKLRLDQAATSVAPADQALASLPVDHAEVKAAQARLDAFKAEIQALDDQIAGRTPPPPPTPTPAPTPGQTPAAQPQAPATPAAPATVRLDYRMEEQLKNARFHLNEVERNIQSLEGVLAGVAQVEDKNTLDHRVLAGAMETLENAERKWANARDALAPVPTNGTGVAEQALRLGQYEAKLSAFRPQLAPVHAQLQRLIDPASYPTLEQDRARMIELSAMYKDPRGAFTQDYARARAALEAAPGAMAELQKFAQVYLPYINQQTFDSKNLGRVGEGMLSNYQSFMATAEEYKQILPQQIRQHLAEAGAYADQAVSEQKPAFFQGGIPQRMGWAEEKLALYEALDPEGYPAMQAEVEGFRAQLSARAKSLESLIIEQNPLPQDRYAGADRKRLEEISIAEWKEVAPDAEVLMVRFPGEQWDRERKLTYSNGTWYDVDRSRLQAQLIVRHDDRLAVIRPINLYMNHINNDKISATRFDALDESLAPDRFVLLTKIKK